MSDQLKYFDPVYERMMYEADNSKDGPLEAAAIEDQPWLQELAATHMQYNVIDLLVPLSSRPYDMFFFVYN